MQKLKILVPVEQRCKFAKRRIFESTILKNIVLERRLNAKIGENISV
jgi:hypothetical protein